MLLKPVNDRYGTHRGLVRLLIANLRHGLGYYQPFERVDWNQARRLVFVCQGNICRSPYAHYIALRHTPAVASFGYATTTGAPANPVAVKVAAERGIDLGGHRTTDISDFHFHTGDVLLVMEDRHLPKVQAAATQNQAQPALLGLWARPRAALLYDPHTLSEAYFHSCYQRIESAVSAVVAEFLAARQ